MDKAVYDDYSIAEATIRSDVQPSCNAIKPNSILDYIEIQIRSFSKCLPDIIYNINNATFRLSSENRHFLSLQIINSFKNPILVVRILLIFPRHHHIIPVNQSQNLIIATWDIEISVFKPHCNCFFKE